MKFKVGDRVVGNEKSRYTTTRTGWCGEVVYADERVIHVKALPGHVGGDLSYPVNPECFDLIRPTDNRKIVVTADGTTTTARLYDGKTLLKSAEAKCSLKDTFDFETGAGLAVDRLLGRKTEEPMPKLFPLADIKAGYLLKVRRMCDDDESFMTVLPSRGGKLGCCGDGNWWYLDCFGDELDYAGREIVAVYGLTHNRTLLDNTPGDRKLLWSRDCT